MIIRIILFLMITLSDISVAQINCSSIDLRRPPIDSVRVQGNTGFCAYFTAADLIGYHAGHSVSALDLAANSVATLYPQFNDSTTPEFMMSMINPLRWTYLFGRSSSFSQQNAFAHDVLEMVFESPRTGYCLEEQTHSEGLANIADNLNRIEDLYNSYREIFGTQNSFEEDRYYEWVNQARDCFFGSIPRDNLLRDIFPNLELNELISILHHVSRNELFRHLSNSSCRRIFTRPELHHANFFRGGLGGLASNLEVLNRIDSLLEAENPPVLNYNHNLLFSTESSGIIDHASLVVGRRFNSNKSRCEYLIRNSWGNSCDSYNIDYECESGMVWVPRHVLTNQINLDVIWLN